MYSQIVSGSYMYISSCEWENKINLQHVHVQCICILREHFMQSLFLHKKIGRDGNLILAWTTEYWCCVYLINDYQVYRLKQIIFLFWNYFFLLELKIELLCYLWCFKACRTIFCNYWQFILQWKKKNITVYILQYRSILFGTIEFCQG